MLSLIESSIEMHQQPAQTPRVLRIIIPTLWVGMIVAISFIEAPLKFQAPGITIPLGLGIGRLVFTALNVAELVLLVALTLISLWPVACRVDKNSFIATSALWVVTVIKIFVVRPPLNARSDVIVAGGDPGPSILHYLYIGMDLLTLVALIVLIVMASKQVAPQE